MLAGSLQLVVALYLPQTLVNTGHGIECLLLGTAVGHFQFSLDHVGGQFRENHIAYDAAGHQPDSKDEYAEKRGHRGVSIFDTAGHKGQVFMIDEVT